jgi:hypothetical protein
MEKEQEVAESAVSRIVERSALYLGLAIAGLAGIALLVAAGVYTDIDFGEWIVPMGWTGLLCWVVVRHSRNFWGLWLFWEAFSALLILHLLILIPLVRAFPRIPAITYVPFIIIEGGVWGAILYAVCRRAARHRSGSHRTQ